MTPECPFDVLWFWWDHRFVPPSPHTPIAMAVLMTTRELFPEVSIHELTEIAMELVC